MRRAARKAVASCAVVLALVGGTTAAIAWYDLGPGSPLRHFYVVPTVWSALRWGIVGGLGAASLALLLDAPLLLGAIETWGLDREAAEGLVTLGLVLLIGGLAGSLVDRARRQLDRYEAVLALQRALDAETPLGTGLALANRVLRRLLRADAVEVVLRHGDAWMGADGPRQFEQGTAGAWVAAHAHSLYLADAPHGTRPGRPRRLFAARLVTGGHVIGIAGAERATAFSRDDRAALEALGVQVALALENARLAHELESKLVAATRRLRELDHAKSEFVSIASHELRTPLTSLRGFSELLLTRRYDAEEARRFIMVIASEAARLGRLLDSLLDLSRIERGAPIELTRTPVAVRPLLESQAELFRAQAPEHRLHVVADADLPALLVDPDAIERILANLVSNAVKYSPAGSEVRLLATAGPGGQVEIAVEDEGVGIPDEALQHVFDRYYRVARPESAARGLGLGLALVKSLVEAHGGSVRVESKRGAGSRFTVSLPAVP